MKQADVSDYTFRVKRVCLDPVIIESFCSEGVFFTSSKVGIICLTMYDLLLFLSIWCLLFNVDAYNKMIMCLRQHLMLLNWTPMVHPMTVVVEMICMLISLLMILS
jgi:hypothetical protein